MYKTFSFTYMKKSFFKPYTVNWCIGYLKDCVSIEFDTSGDQSLENLLHSIFIDSITMWFDELDPNDLKCMIKNMLIALEIVKNEFTN